MSAKAYYNIRYVTIHIGIPLHQVYCNPPLRIPQYVFKYNYNYRCDCIHPIPLRLTPFLSYHALQVTPINPNYAQLCLGTPSPSVHRQGPEDLLDCTPSALGMQIPSKITWPSHDN